MRTKERISWIDFAKAVSITLVVLGHVPLTINSEFIEAFRSFRMPFFFFLAGCLAKNRTVSEQLKNAKRTLIIPCALLYLICYIIWVPFIFPRHPDLYGEGASLQNIVIKPALGLLFGNGYHTEYSTMVNIPLWFLFALIIVKVIHSIILQFCKGDNMIYFFGVSVCVIIFYIVSRLGIDLYWSFDSALLAFPFYAIGNRLSPYLLNSNSMKAPNYNAISNLFLGVFLLLLLVKQATLNGFVDVDHSLYGNSLGLFYATGLIGILSMILLSQCYHRKWEVITIISNGTIIILAFHGWVTKIILVVIGYSIDTTTEASISPFAAVGVSILTVLAMVPLILIVRRYFPALMGGRR